MAKELRSAPFNTESGKICQVFDIRSTFHSGQTRRPAPTSQYGVPLSSQVCTNVAQIESQYIKKLLGFYKIVAGHVCAQLGGKNIILLETIVQVQQAVRWNRNVSMLSLDTAGIFKTTFFGFPTNYFCFTSVSQFCDQIKTILKLPLVIKLNTIYLLECFCMETCSKTAEVHCWDKLL